MSFLGKLLGQKNAVGQQLVDKASSISAQLGLLQPIQVKPMNVQRIVVDVETTGLSSSYDEILQLSICNGKGETVWNQYYKPRKLSKWDEASRVNGIYPRDVKKAPYITQDLSIIQDVLNHSTEIVFYNAAFDTSFLTAIGLVVEESKVIDAMKEYSDFCREQGHGGSWRKLEEAALETGYGPFAAHDALNDVRATAHVIAWVDRQRQAIEDANPIRTENVPRHLDTPDLDFGAFQFVARAFPCDEVRKINKATGVILESKKTYYADGDLIKRLYADIRTLEKQIDRTVLGLGDDVAKAKRSIRATEVIGEKTPTFELIPLTATGKKPKFAVKAVLVESRWDEKRSMMTDGVAAELYYLQNGALGKASLRYIVARNLYDIQFKEEKGSAVLSRIDFTNHSTWETTKLL